MVTSATKSLSRGRKVPPEEPVYQVDGVPCITASAAARAHGVSRQAARYATVRGALKFRMLGDRIMIPLATLWEWKPDYRQPSQHPKAGGAPRAGQRRARRPAGKARPPKVRA